MKIWFLYIILFSGFYAMGQSATAVSDSSSYTTTNDDSTAIMQVSHHSAKRIYLVTGAHAAIYTGTFLTLSQAWYKDYPKSGFHIFNDSKEWLQVDKVGHSWTAYTIARGSAGLWRWAGQDHKKSVWLGGASSLGFQTFLEVLDAHSAQWGWSWADVAANISGTSLFVAQELAWKEQRIQFKFSTHPINYKEAMLEDRANDLFGEHWQERILKDYNGQTYWLSFNLASFTTKKHLPAWLNLAVGYGGDGIFGGFDNTSRDKNGVITFDRSDIPRRRQWYLSPDIDFTKIKTNKKGVRTLLFALNTLKLPAPALELSGGKIKGHWLYF